MSFDYLSQILENQKIVFKSGKTKNVQFRRIQLEQIVEMLEENMESIIEAFRLDYKKPELEIRVEINAVCSRAKYTLNNLTHWTNGYSVAKDYPNFHTELYSLPQPYGCVLIIAPWSFPILLLLEPLIGAIAAGNTSILKTSKLVPHLSLKLKDLFEIFLDDECYKIITDPECGKILTQLKFDFVFFTGSKKVGTLIYQSLSRNLTPATLDLGGSCPCYVHKDACVEVAAHRIAWIKTINAGQLSITVNHVLVHKDIYKEFIKGIISSWEEFYGPNIKESVNYGRIVTENQTKDLINFIENYKEEKIFFGDYDIKDRFITPCILKCSSKSSDLMKKEIFGPILIIKIVNDEKEALDIIENNSKPLQIYLFTYDTEIIKKFKENTISGTLIINETALSFASFNLPYGGVGESGIGRYHGLDTFRTFSNFRSIYRERFHPPLIDSIIYPPYNERTKNIVDAYGSNDIYKLCRIL